MSDSLRDRIAMTQQAHVFCITECSCGHEFSWEKSTEWRERAELEWAQHVADAVIAALTEFYHVTERAAPLDPVWEKDD